MRNIWLAVLCLLCAAPGVAGAMQANHGGHTVPQPRQVAPVPDKDEVLVVDGPTVRFAWTAHVETARQKHFDFRIYRGHETVESGLFVNVKTKKLETDVKSDLFEDGKTYTWSVRQIYDQGDKSDRSFSSFKVRKPSSQSPA